MSEIRKALTETLEGVREGTVPLDTAQQVHLVAHRHVMDRYADIAEKRMGTNGLIEKAKELLLQVT